MALLSSLPRLSFFVPSYLMEFTLSVFNSSSAPLFPAPQLVLRRNPSPDPRFQPDTAAAALTGIDLEPGARALYLGRAHYGCLATVLPPVAAGMTKKVRHPLLTEVTHRVG